ncbi:MAG: hypothetical protein ACREPI_04130 [Candidatus Dormibacterales bacterium]
MRRLDLASARLKLKRGDYHLLTLEQEVGEWASPEDDPVIVQRWQHEHQLQYTSVFAERLKPIPESWGLLIGDTLNNYRSCLDHLAYAITRLGSANLRDEKVARSVEFPILRCPLRDLSAAHPDMTRVLPGASVTYVVALLPFQPGKRPGIRRWQLAALKRLNNLDKHREPLLIHHVVSYAHLLSSTPRPVTVEPRPGAFRPKAGAEIVRLVWQFGQPPFATENLNAGFNPDEPQMGVQFNPACTVAFRQPMARREVLRAMWDISLHIAELLEAVDRI